MAGKSWAIRVAYLDNYLAFCATDEETGELTGALKDYLDYVSGCMKNATIEFKPIAYTTVADALDALKNKDVDCVFPASFDEYASEQIGG